MTKNESYYPQKAVIEVWRAELVPVLRENRNKLPYIIGKAANVDGCFEEFYYFNDPVYIIETEWHMHKTSVIRRYHAIQKLFRIEKRRKRHDYR